MRIIRIYDEAKCPICNKTIIGYYCPFCGLPMRITTEKKDKYGHKLYTHLEFRTYSIYPVCKKCDTLNPHGAQYCRNCGEKMHECKYNNKEGSLKPRNLDEVKHGGNAEDIIQDGGIYKIIEKSCEGFYDEHYGKNAIVVIIERCIKKDNRKIEGTGEVLINLSAFDRAVVPYRKEADGTLLRDGETVRADGTAVVAWKTAKNAKEFMKANNGKVLKFTLKKEVSTRAWDRAVDSYSKTELCVKKVYTIDWV